MKCDVCGATVAKGALFCNKLEEQKPIISINKELMI